MRVAVVGPTYPFRGGISHYTTLMVQCLRERHDVLFVSYLKQYPQFLFPGRSQLDDSGKPIQTECERDLSFANPISWRKAARRIVDYDPDAVIFSWVNPALAVQFRVVTGYVKRRMPSVRILFWCHNVAQHERLPMSRAMTRFAFRHGDRFVVTGQESRRNLLQMRPGSSVSVSYLPSLDVFTGEPPGPGARQELGLDSEAPVALYFGFVRAYKGLVHLLDAMPEAVARVPRLHLLVVGEFWDDRSAYEEIVRRHHLQDSVTIIDRYVPNEEVASYFKCADLVVLPYVTATGSGIVQVAYGFGKPVLTTTVGSLPEVVDDGETGYLVRPGDPAAIASAMVDFFASGRGDQFARNIEAARGRFSWDDFIRTVELQTP